MMAAERTDLNLQVTREMERATELWIIRASWLEKFDEKDADERPHEVERFVAWFFHEEQAKAHLEKLRREARGHSTAPKSSWSNMRGISFGIRHVTQPIAMFNDAQKAEEFCESAGAEWLGRADSIRARIRKANP